jgi:RimJ/RimL family protein N-acetyltransferase
MAWLPEDWDHPQRVELPTGHHLRPIRAADVDLDMSAVMGSQQRLWSIYGAAWGWPPPSMTREQDAADLHRHADEMETHESFNYALFDEAETELIGCVYVDSTDLPEADAEISWWVRDEYVGSEVEAALDAFVPRWIAADWPLHHPRFGTPPTETDTG